MNDLIWHLTDAMWFGTAYGNGGGYSYGDRNSDSYGDGDGNSDGYICGFGFWNSTSAGMKGAANGNGMFMFRRKIC